MAVVSPKSSFQAQYHLSSSAKKDVQKSSNFAFIVIWLHLAATTVWLCGLPMLFLALRQGGIPAAKLVPRFSQAALFSVGILIVTGIYNAISYVGIPKAFIATTYGRALIIKTGIFTFLLTLGAVNLFVWTWHSPLLNIESG